MSPRRSPRDGWPAWWWRHRWLGVVLVPGVVLRVLTQLAYQPALLYIDSFHYLDTLASLDPSGLHPIGYVFVLRALLPLGGLALVAAVQHLLGIGIAIALYALAVRLRVPRGLAALVAAAVLLDGYQLQIEQNIMSEIWQQALLVGVLWALLHRRPPAVRWVALAGLLIGLAIITRTISAAVVLPVALYLVAVGGEWRSRAGWRRILLRSTAGLAALAVVLVSYAGYYRAVAGVWGITGVGTQVAFGRAATIADCDRLPLDATLAQFCPEEPREERRGVDWYTHQVYNAPGFPGPLPEGASKADLSHQFAGIVFTHQPLDLTVAVLGDFAKNFSPVKITFPEDVPAERWQFQTGHPEFNDGGLEVYSERFSGRPPTTVGALTTFLRDYQLSIGYVPGPVLALAALFGLAGAGGLGRARGSGLRSAAFLPTASGLVILLASAAFEFSWRYQLPALVLLPLGGAVGLAALLGLGRGAGRPQLAPFPDEVDQEALDTFVRRYGPISADSHLPDSQRLSSQHPDAQRPDPQRPDAQRPDPQRPVQAVLAGPDLVLLIAAYNEEEGLGAVLDGLPDRVSGLGATRLVVVDGATDATAQVAAEHGAYVCEMPRNRGQGAALRTGYHLAHAMGARYVVTTDADGQYDNAELPQLLAPLLAGTADFVTGSRRLGSEDPGSRLRWFGVRVFAWLASRLTGERITDTSFGFRAMRTEQAVALTLAEPQYQASELLLGMLAGGARLRELPLTMRLRSSGASKKGPDVVYGCHYARVMLGTWVREYLRPSGSRRRTGRTARTSART